MADTVLDNETITMVVDGERATARVHRRPDVDSAKGAQRAVELADRVTLLLARGVREVVLDLRDAPPVAGPITTEALGRLLASCERVGARAAVIGAEDPIQVLQLKRLVTSHAPKIARLVHDEADADLWLIPPPPSRRR